MTQDKIAALLNNETYNMLLNCMLRDKRIENVLPQLEFIMTYADIRGLDKDAIQQAMQIAFVVHDGQTRIGETMIEHIFKVTRNTVHFMYETQKRCVGTELALSVGQETAHIIGAILHDSVEDALEELTCFLSKESNFFVRKNAKEIHSAREKVYDLVTMTFGVAVTDILRAVTNPYWDKKEFSQKIRFDLYKDKIKKLIEEAPMFVVLLKLGDNYVNLDFEPGTTGADGMIRKYGPLCQTWIGFLNSAQVVSALGKETREKIIAQYVFIEKCWHDSLKQS